MVIQDGIFECGGDVALPNYGVKRGGAVFPSRNNEIFHTAKLVIFAKKVVGLNKFLWCKVLI